MSQQPTGENRYQLVNTIAKKAKVMINHDTTAQLSQHNAIQTAMTNDDEATTPQAQPPSA